MVEKSLIDKAVSHELIEKLFLNALEVILKNKILLFTVYGIIASYFYNLPVLKYSIKGDNEFRLYDILGVVLMLFYYKFYNTVDVVIRKVFFLKILRRFMIWAGITMVMTLFFHILADKLVGFLQVILYMYHFWVFYVAAVFFYIFCLNATILKTGIYLILFLSIGSCLIIIMQNLGLISFLWSDIYFKGYQGFLSGTLGPNKIVTGMTSLFVASLCFGLLLEKQYRINILVVYVAVLLNIYIIFISGSRTTYVAFLILLVFFAVRSPLRFILGGSVLLFSFTIMLSAYPNLQKTFDQTLENRIFSKTEVFDEGNNDAEYSDAYEDLGSGRENLTKNNLIYILENPQMIPFGTGFVNHLNKTFGKSAHNMYLQSIRETGLVGFFLYFGWLLSYLFIRFDKYKGFSIALQGLVFAMLVTLFFGEHLYIYRPLFGLLGLFLIITSIFVASLHKIEIKS
ncbi:O-antigen ligase family protein [Flavobacterium sp. SM2513]|uniref:O-antigen ligase family protein n=1 Tax=Flavobacterium sp. SM2513 TaxID=3424766 RepID=UPI003D7F6EA4